MGLKIGNLETYGIIYKIENLVNGKVYIGQTTNDNGFNGRYHNDIVKYTHNKHLKRSFKKYGLDNFEINEMFDIAFSKEELDIKEKCWINIYDSCNLEKGYNNADGGSRGKIHKTGTMIYNIDTGYTFDSKQSAINYFKLKGIEISDKWITDSFKLNYKENCWYKPIFRENVDNFYCKYCGRKMKENYICNKCKNYKFIHPYTNMKEKIIYIVNNVNPHYRNNNKKIVNIINEQLSEQLNIKINKCIIYDIRRKLLDKKVIRKNKNDFLHTNKEIEFVENVKKDFYNKMKVKDIKNKYNLSKNEWDYIRENYIIVKEKKERTNLKDVIDTILEFDLYNENNYKCVSIISDKLNSKKINIDKVKIAKSEIYLKNLYK